MQIDSYESTSSIETVSKPTVDQAPIQIDSDQSTPSIQTVSKPSVDQAPIQIDSNQSTSSIKSKPQTTDHTSIHTSIQIDSDQSTTSSIEAVSKPQISDPDQSTLPTESKSQTKGPTRGKEKIDCHPNDIGLVLGRIPLMTDSEKLDFIENVWKPCTDYKYPQNEENKRKWRFSNDYITPGKSKYYHWLAYSAHHDGVFCIACALFGKTVSTQSKLQKLFTEPFMRWNGMNTRFKNHQENSELHRACMEIKQALQSQRKGETQKISTVIDKNKAKRIEKNRSKIMPIIKTVVLCARQNIPMRGHRDDSKHIDDASNNPGNFQELLKFRVDSGDVVLKDHLENCPKNASYRSKTIQNEILSCIGNYTGIG
ncbi:uncharacterized protein [Clytia hemisphaerica]|uniref:uncharacterized protein n=1 Tax=Clytia hemisphaerica TaxID=252671 RepID=UPI0034D55A91